MNYLTGALRFILIVISIPFFMFVAGVRFPKAEEAEYRKLVETWCRRLLAMLGVRVSYTGRPLRHPAPGEKGYLLLSNHISFLDIFSIDTLICSRFVAKAEISRWPAFGTIAKGVRSIFIERGNRRAILAIAEQMESALNRGENVIFFPEGTTSLGNTLLPLHANLIEAAVATGATVQPLVLRYKSRGKLTTRMSYAGDVSIFHCLWNVVTTPDATVEVEVLDPIDPAGKNRHQICREVSARMAAALGVRDPAIEEERRELTLRPVLKQTVRTKADSVP